MKVCEIMERGRWLSFRPPRKNHDESRTKNVFLFSAWAYICPKSILIRLGGCSPIARSYINRSEDDVMSWILSNFFCQFTWHFYIALWLKYAIRKHAVTTPCKMFIVFALLFVRVLSHSSHDTILCDIIQKDANLLIELLQLKEW